MIRCIILKCFECEYQDKYIEFKRVVNKKYNYYTVECPKCKVHSFSY